MKIWQNIKEYLASGQNVCLLTVISSRGSSPGRRGFKMLVTGNGDLHGSIGGGLMEHNLVELARSKLSENDTKTFIKHQTHNKKSKHSSGMVCSGQQTIAFNFLSASDLSTVQQLLNESSVIQLSQQGLNLSKTDVNETNIESEENWFYSEKQQDKSKVHLFGAGHVSLPTSKLLVDLGFEVHLYDNRSSINTLEDNQFVSSKKIIDYQKVSQQVHVSANDYVILMTHKCAEDMLILRQLLDKQLKYLWVLGSKNKIKLMFNHLLEKGFCKDKLATVHAPIGLPIKSQTTEEIAVSIAAELIQFRNNLK